MARKQLETAIICIPLRVRLIKVFSDSYESENTYHIACKSGAIPMLNCKETYLLR